MRVGSAELMCCTCWEAAQNRATRKHEKPRNPGGVTIEENACEADAMLKGWGSMRSGCNVKKGWGRHGMDSCWKEFVNSIMNFVLMTAALTAPAHPPNDFPNAS